MGYPTQWQHGQHYLRNTSIGDWQVDEILSGEAIFSHLHSNQVHEGFKFNICIAWQHSD